MTWSNLKEKGDCECTSGFLGESCGLYGTLGKPDGEGRRHVRGCPCRRCVGRRSRHRGAAKQRAARRALGLPGPSLGADHEEDWRHACRLEVKSGARDAGPPWTRFQAMERQSEARRPVGDNRLFAAVWMPPGTSEGLFACRLSQVVDVALDIVEQLIEEERDEQ